MSFFSFRLLSAHNNFQRCFTRSIGSQVRRQNVISQINDICGKNRFFRFEGKKFIFSFADFQKKIQVKTLRKCFCSFEKRLRWDYVELNVSEVLSKLSRNYRNRSFGRVYSNLISFALAGPQQRCLLLRVFFSDFA